MDLLTVVQIEYVDESASAVTPVTAPLNVQTILRNEAERILGPNLRRGEFVVKVYYVDKPLATYLASRYPPAHPCNILCGMIIFLPFLIIFMICFGPCGVYDSLKPNELEIIEDIARRMAVVTNKGIYLITAPATFPSHSSCWGCEVGSERKLNGGAPVYMRWRDVRQISLYPVVPPSRNDHVFPGHTVYIFDGRQCYINVDDATIGLAELELCRLTSLREDQDAPTSL